MGVTLAAQVQSKLSQSNLDTVKRNVLMVVSNATLLHKRCRKKIGNSPDYAASLGVGRQDQRSKKTAHRRSGGKALDRSGHEESSEVQAGKLPQGPRPQAEAQAVGEKRDAPVRQHRARP